MRRVAAAMLCLTLAQCGGSPSSPSGITPPDTFPPGSPSVPVPVVPSVPQVFVGAGDIAMCDANAEATARLLDGIGGTVFALGDNAYLSGTAQEYRDCYDPTWGRHKGRTRPTPGNHEYLSTGAAPYYAYFGANAGPSGLGYYSFDLGAWHAISLNSNVPAGPGSAQAAWLRTDLAASRARCTIAYWHHPLFTSGPSGGTPAMRDLWQLLYDADAEIVLNGHDHLYERFRPQDPDGFPDAARGLRQFTVGTGGGILHTPASVSPNREVIRTGAFGVLRLTLLSDGYDWDFLPVSGAGDSGHGACH